MPTPTLSRDPAVFVVGVQRSGTTLLCAMLSRHPELYVTNELPWHLYESLSRDGACSSDLLRHLREHSVFDEYLGQTKSSIRDTPWSLLEGALLLRMHHLGKRRWGAKDPRLTPYLPDFAARYRNAKFIVILRDARATTASQLRQRFNVANAYTGANLWKEEVAAQLKFAREFPDRTLVCQYAQLLHEPRGTLQAICRFLEMEFAEEMLDPTAPTDIVIHDGNKNVTRPPMIERTDSWRQQLTTRQIAVIESVAGDLLRELGFQVEHPPVPISFLARCAYALHQWTITNLRWQAHGRFRLITSGLQALRSQLSSRTRRASKRREDSPLVQARESLTTGNTESLNSLDHDELTLS